MSWTVAYEKLVIKSFPDLSFGLNVYEGMMKLGKSFVYTILMMCWFLKKCTIRCFLGSTLTPMLPLSLIQKFPHALSVEASTYIVGEKELQTPAFTQDFNVCLVVGGIEEDILS